MLNKYLVVICCFLVLIEFFAIKSCNNNKKSIQITKYASIAISDSGKRYKDLWESEHLEKLQVIADKNTLEILFKNRIDSILKRNGIKKRQLVDFVKIETQSEGSLYSVLKPDTVNIFQHYDSIVKVSTFSDDLINAKIYINPINDSVKLIYYISLSLEYSSYWKRPYKLLFIRFGKKKLYVNVFSNNDNVYIKDVQSVKLQ